MAAKILRVKKDSLSSSRSYLCAAFIRYTLSFRPSLCILVESRNREFQSECKTAPVKQLYGLYSRSCLYLAPAITFPHPSLIFSLRIFIYTVLTARLICPFFFFLISHLCHTFSILWPTLLFSSSLLPLFALFHVHSLSTVVHSWPRLHFNFIFGSFSLLHLIIISFFAPLYRLVFSFFILAFLFSLRCYLTLIFTIFIICFLFVFVLKFKFYYLLLLLSHHFSFSL